MMKLKKKIKKEDKKPLTPPRLACEIYDPGHDTEITIYKEK
jgi:hypothetical protein